MKGRILFLFAALMLAQVSRSQHNKHVVDSVYTGRNIPIKDCDSGLLKFTDSDLLKHKSVLFIFNNSLHPLGRTEFMDSNKIVRYLSTPFRMNRCTLLYVDSGVHRFHTMYQSKDTALLFKPGEIFMAELTTHTVWPLPVVIRTKENKEEEYGAVLLRYITADESAILLKQLKNKEVIINK
ncbi:MAG TPA: hypothetical protein PLA68_00540 [Panacibacter sp.]|nr:hypothetical protein [Panacibacter sp.]